MHKDPVGADTGLTGITEFRCHHAFDGKVEIGILKDDERRIAAKFHGEAFQRAHALFGQDFANLGRAREGELFHDRAGGQLAANGAGIAADDIHNTWRNTDAVAELRNGERRKRGL